MEKVIYVTKPLMPKMDRYVDELKKIWNAGWLTNNGPEYMEFQKKLDVCRDLMYGFDYGAFFGKSEL